MSIELAGAVREDQLRREVAGIIFATLAERLGVRGQHGQWARVAELTGLAEHNLVAYRRGRGVSLGYLLRLAERHGVQLTITIDVNETKEEDHG